MKRNESMREHRSLNPFKHIRFGFAPIEAEDEFASCLNEASDVRPDYFRWFWKRPTSARFCKSPRERPGKGSPGMTCGEAIRPS